MKEFKGTAWFMLHKLWTTAFGFMLSWKDKWHCEIFWNACIGLRYVLST